MRSPKSAAESGVQAPADLRDEELRLPARGGEAEVVEREFSREGVRSRSCPLRLCRRRSARCGRAVRGPHEIDEARRRSPRESPRATGGRGACPTWMRAHAASAPAKTTFSVCSTLIPAALQDAEDVGEDADAVAVPDGQEVRRGRAAREVDGVRDLSASRRTRRRCARSRPRSRSAPGPSRRRRGASRRRRGASRSRPRTRPCRPPAPSRRRRGRPGAPCSAIAPARAGCVHDLAAARVHEERARLHRLEELRVEHALRLLRERAVDRHDVGGGRERVDRVGARDAEPLGAVVVQGAAPRDDGHPERLRARRRPRGRSPRGRSTPSVRPGEAPRLPVLRLVPDAVAQVHGLLDEAPVEREEEAPRELGDGDRVLARAVRDGDGARRRGRRGRSCSRRRPPARSARGRRPSRSRPPSPSSSARRGPRRPVSASRAPRASPSSFGS